MPQSLTRTSHTHSQRKKGEDSHAVGVTGKEGLVDTDTGEVVNVTRFGETNDGVDKDIGLARTSSADSQLTVSAVHGVSGLESDNSGPAKLVKVQTNLCRRVSESDVVVVHQTVNGIDLATNVEVTSSSVQVLDGRVSLIVSTKDLDSLLLLVGAVDVVDSNDGQVAVISEVTEGDTGTRLCLDFVNCLLEDIKTDGHGEKVAVDKTVVVDHTVVINK